MSFDFKFNRKDSKEFTKSAKDIRFTLNVSYLTFFDYL